MRIYIILYIGKVSSGHFSPFYLIQGFCLPTAKLASILYKSTAGRYRPVSYPDGPITARCRFIKNAYWEGPEHTGPSISAYARGQGLPGAVNLMLWESCGILILSAPYHCTSYLLCLLLDNCSVVLTLIYRLNKTESGIIISRKHAYIILTPLNPTFL